MLHPAISNTANPIRLPTEYRRSRFVIGKKKRFSAGCAENGKDVSNRMGNLLDWDKAN
jgi:hypothetical protein